MALVSNRLFHFMTDNEKPLADTLAQFSDEEWSWTRRYNPALFQHVHALGVIAANFNQLETDLQLLIYIFLSMHNLSGGVLKAHRYLLQQLNNAERIGLLEQFYKEKVSGTELADLLDWFVLGYRTCAENRNMLMHSVPHGSTLDALKEIATLDLIRSSRKNPIDDIFVSLELKDLRRVADDIDRFGLFGHNLALGVLGSFRGGKIWFRGQEVPAPLPAKPPKPLALKFVK
jgi:hypothetical protein